MNFEIGEPVVIDNRYHNKFKTTISNATEYLTSEELEVLDPTIIDDVTWISNSGIEYEVKIR